MIKSWARQLGAWLLAWGAEPADAYAEVVAQPEPERDDQHIIAAVFKGFVCYGLPVAEFEPHFDLAEKGKFYDVMGYASQVLNTAGERRTICELVDYLRKP